MPDELLGTAALKVRGWTDTLIRRFLPTPDLTKVNPHYRSGPPMRLYNLARVEQIEGTPEFQTIRTKTAVRQDAARKAVDTKRRQLQEYLDGLRIEVPALEPEALYREACKHYNEIQEWRACEGLRTSDRRATPDSEPKFLDHIAVNYLRHQLTIYEKELDRIAGKVGASDAYVAIKEAVLDAIAVAYPTLAPECRRQAQELVGGR